MRRLPHALVGLALAGCSFDGGAATRDSGAPTSDVEDAGCAVELPFTATNIGDPCALPEPGPALMLDGGAYEIDTSADQDVLRNAAGDPVDVVTTVLPQEGGPELLVIVAESIELAAGSELRASGERALVLVSSSHMSISGRLDVAARGSDPGPGADHADSCATGQGSPGEMQTTDGGSSGGSGGGGGGFGSAGGSGAQVAESDADPVGGGAAIEVGDLVPLRGGCGGGAGASDTGGVGGVGGGGGGAVQLIAASTIDVTLAGTVNAGGGGGDGAAGPRGGGGGGGSGGTIVLMGDDVFIDGVVAANGGGGGEGTRGSAAPAPGTDATGAGVATGGSGGNSGGDGGDGASGGDDGMPGKTGVPDELGATGGGGGGGGTGHVVLQAQGELKLSGTVTPPAR